MTLTPDFLLALLVLSALISTALSMSRPQHVRRAALISMALFGFIWIAIRGALPLTATIGAAGAAWSQWVWQIGPFSWSLGLFILLLTLAALALTAPSAPASQPLQIQLLASVALLACWAANFATYVLTWTLLNTLWLATVIWHNRQQPALEGLPLRTQIAFSFSSILLLWLAGSTAGATDAAPESWSTLTHSLVLLAATCQLLIFPVYLWRSHRHAPPPVAALLVAAPAAAGALLLSRLESATDIGLAFALPFTLAGLLALLIGARRAWTARAGRATLPIALIQAQSGLVLLAAIWAEPQAILAESAVLILAGGILLLANNLPAPPIWPLPIQPGALVALATLAALPLTRGFAGRSATYGAWLAHGRWLLVLVAVLLHIPLLIAAFRLLLPAASPAAPPPASEASAAAGPARLVPVVALLLPTLGLFSIAGLTVTPLVAWLAILLPAIAAAVLAWRLDESVELRQTLREAFTVPLPDMPTWLNLRRPIAAAVAAAREALALLEGEGGLLWLLLFVVVIYLVR